MTDSFLIHFFPNFVICREKMQPVLYRYVKSKVNLSCGFYLWCDVTVVRQAVRNLQLTDETTESLKASWEMNDPYVESYRISYFGDNHKEESVS